MLVIYNKILNEVVRKEKVTDGFLFQEKDNTTDLLKKIACAKKYELSVNYRGYKKKRKTKHLKI